MTNAAATTPLAMMTMVLAVAIMAACPASAEFHSGSVSSEDGFAYLGKFCYDYTERPPERGMPDGSTMTLSVVLQTDPSAPIPANTRLYVFDDQPSSWPQVYHRDVPCALKVAKSRNSTPVHFDDPASPGRWTMPIARIHEHVRPRFWYIVLANCDGFEDVYYEVKFTNQGGVWRREFGVNEQGLNTLYVLFFVLYAAALLVQGYSLQTMWKAEMLHPIIKLCSAVILLQFVSVFCGLVHYSTFVSNGSGAPTLDAGKEVFSIAAKLVFQLTLILIAQGWTISTDVVENRGFIVTVMGFFISCYCALAVWDVLGRDPASTLYLYESVPGVMIVFLDVVCGAWFAKSIAESREEEKDEDKKAFYKSIGIGYTIWFLALPVIVLGVAFQLDPWVREYTVSAISLSVSTVAYFMLAFMLWPTRADQYFRLTVPDVLDDGGDGL